MKHPCLKTPPVGWGHLGARGTTLCTFKKKSVGAIVCARKNPFGINIKHKVNTISLMCVDQRPTIAFKSKIL